MLLLGVVVSETVNALLVSNIAYKITDIGKIFLMILLLLLSFIFLFGFLFTQNVHPLTDSACHMIAFVHLLKFNAFLLGFFQTHSFCLLTCFRHDK